MPAHGMLTAAGAVAALLLLTRLACRGGQKQSGADSDSPSTPPVPGKKDIILFITSDAASSVNVHLATCLALLQQPGAQSLEVHYASCPAMQARVQRIADAAGGHIHFHTCSAVTQKTVRKFTPIPILPPGRAAVEGWAAIATGPGSLYGRWTDAEFDGAYETVARLIADVDPAVVVTARDSAMLPIKAAARDSRRRWVILFPNALFDSFVWAQRWLRAGWKFPAVASGHPFPLPWPLVPLNMYITLRWLLGFRHMQRHAAAERSYLARYDVRDIHLPPRRRPQLYQLSASVPDAQIPMDDLRSGTVHVVGPAVLSIAPVVEQDAGLHAWLTQSGRRTVLVNLGSLMRYDPRQTTTMGTAISHVLSRLPEVQVLWKLSTQNDEPYHTLLDEVLAPYIHEDRVRIETWLSVDPAAVLRSGRVVLSVHHAGAGSYHEAIAAGVPHVVLPLWFDCYNYAALVEDCGLGVWACKGTAPEWTVGGVAASMLRVLDEKTGESFRERAREACVMAPDGAARAADIIAGLAGLGMAKDA